MSISLNSQISALVLLPVKGVTPNFSVNIDGALFDKYTTVWDNYRQISLPKMKVETIIIKDKSSKNNLQLCGIAVLAPCDCAATVLSELYLSAYNSERVVGGATDGITVYNL